MSGRAISRTNILYGFEETDVPRWFDFEKCLQEHVLDAFEKLPDLDDDIWGKVVIMEKNVRVAKAYLRHTVVAINGSTQDFDGYTLGFKSFENPHRDKIVEQCRRLIGGGLKVRVEIQGDVYVKRLSRSPISAYSLNQQTGQPCGDLEAELVRIRLPEQTGTVARNSVKVFDMRQFKKTIETEVRGTDSPNTRRLMLRTVIPFALVRESSEILNTPCWFFLINLVALDMLSLKIPFEDEGNTQSIPRSPVNRRSSDSGISHSDSASKQSSAPGSTSGGSASTSPSPFDQNVKKPLKQRANASSSSFCSSIVDDEVNSNPNLGCGGKNGEKSKRRGVTQSSRSSNSSRESDHRDGSGWSKRGGSNSANHSQTAPGLSPAKSMSSLYGIIEEQHDNKSSRPRRRSNRDHETGQSSTNPPEAIFPSNLDPSNVKFGTLPNFRRLGIKLNTIDRSATLHGEALEITIDSDLDVQDDRGRSGYATDHEVPMSQQQHQKSSSKAYQWKWGGSRNDREMKIGGQMRKQSSEPSLIHALMNNNVGDFREDDDNNANESGRTMRKSYQGSRSNNRPLLEKMSSATSNESIYGLPSMKNRGGRSLNRRQATKTGASASHSTTKSYSEHTLCRYGSVQTDNDAKTTQPANMTPDKNAISSPSGKNIANFPIKSSKSTPSTLWSLFGRQPKSYGAFNPTHYERSRPGGEAGGDDGAYANSAFENDHYDVVDGPNSYWTVAEQAGKGGLVSLASAPSFSEMSDSGYADGETLMQVHRRGDIRQQPFLSTLPGQVYDAANLGPTLPNAPSKLLIPDSSLYPPGGILTTSPPPSSKSRLQTMFQQNKQKPKKHKRLTMDACIIPCSSGEEVGGVQMAAIEVGGMGSSSPGMVLTRF